MVLSQGNVAMILSIVGVILSVVSIAVSILCWRFAYSSVNKYNRYITQLYNIDFSKEGAFEEFGQITKKIYKIKKSEEKLEVNFSHQKDSEEKITKDDLIACLYNFQMNLYNECDKHEDNKKSGN